MTDVDGLLERLKNDMSELGVTTVSQFVEKSADFSGKIISAQFWKHVSKSEESSCWLWNGSRGNTGYGRLTVRVSGYGEYAKAGIGAHRIAFIMKNGPIPDGLVIDHLCRIRNCVNPSHLEAVSNKENVRRGCAFRYTGLCPHGHEMTDANTFRRTKKDGRVWTGCIQCRKAAYSRWVQRRGGREFIIPPADISSETGRIEACIASEAYTSGLTISEISERIGISQYRVKRLLVASGVTLRKPGQRTSEVLARKGANPC